MRLDMWLDERKITKHDYSVEVTFDEYDELVDIAEEDERIISEQILKIFDPNGVGEVLIVPTKDLSVMAALQEKLENNIKSMQYMLDRNQTPPTGMSELQWKAYLKGKREVYQEILKEVE